MRFVDVNGLAGGSALGFIQAGFTLTHRTGELKLGAENMRANRPLTGWDWEDDFSPDPTDWHVPDDIQVVSGNPPCSAWSTMTLQKYRGQGADVLKHTNDLVQYAGRIAPPIVAFESVQQAFTTGREHMQLLRAKLEADTGYEYDLYHVKHNNASLGGASQRKRYWWVASRIPFGMDPPVPIRVPTLMESIGDLRGLRSTWENQPYVYPQTWWSSRHRSADGAVDGHAIRLLMHEKRIRALLDALDGDWPQGWKEEDACRAIYAKHGRLPDEWATQEARLVSKNFTMGPNQTARWYSDKPGRVLTGAALDQAIHPTELRLFTLREAMRIQGFPDTWKLWPSRAVATAPLWPGKGVPVGTARWLGVWAKRALEGQPGSMRGVPLGDREYLLDSTHNYKLAPYEEGRLHPAR